MDTAIRLVTWSKWSHVALLLGDGTAIEAVWPRVRRVREQDLFAAYDKHRVVDIHCVDEEAARLAAMSQVGKPYDLSAIFGLLMHRDWQSRSKWFCSELVTWTLAEGGLTLFRGEDMSRITPQHLWMLNYPIV